jgi:adenylate kinase family enzyme
MVLLLTGSKPLKNLALESDKIAQEILSILGTLQVPPKGSKWKTLSQAVRTKWHASEISDLESRLQRNREVLQYHVLISVKEDQIQCLIKDEENRKILASVLQDGKDMAANMTAQTDEILRHQQAGSQLALKHHHEVLNAISQQPHNTTGSQDDTAQTVKDMLYFHRKDDRFDDISEAHKRTFNWALDDQASSGKWPSLLGWLRDEGGVYWISGKAGSGKSTLMKYLDSDPRTMQALQTWAGSGDLVVASFYFWNHGALIQRSQEGLFRSILWQILDERPSLASILFPDMFHAGVVWEDFPTFHQLRRAFKRLTTKLSSTLKVAIIVDGLDEFEANKLTMKELAELFLTASKSSNFKALVSSRPLTAFETSFKNTPKLRLHQLTHMDITAYVNDELGTHPHYHDVLLENKRAMTALMAELVHSASGVFLWVKLAVRNLVEGLDNCDTLPDLRHRLRMLPRDLEDLFRHMLKSIPGQYETQSSKIFQLLRCSREDVGLTAKRLAYADLDEAAVFQADVRPMSPTEMFKKEKEVILRLKSRCAGLLEARSYSHGMSVSIDDLESGENGEVKVTYLHKSVADYITRDDVWRDISGRTMASDFDAPRTLLQCAIMEIKTRPLLSAEITYPSHLGMLITDAMYFAQLVEGATGVAPSALLDVLDSAVSKRYSMNPDLLLRKPSTVLYSHWYEPSKRYSMNPDLLLRKPGTGLYSRWYEPYDREFHRSQKEDSQGTFCSVLISHGLKLSAIEEIRREGANCIAKLGRPLLDYACRPHLDYAPQPRLALLLLENGADANQTWCNESLWQHALDFYPSSFEPIDCVRVLKLLVQYGADPHAVLERRKIYYGLYRQSALRVVISKFKRCLEGRKDPSPEVVLVGTNLETVYTESERCKVDTLLIAPTSKSEQLKEEVLSLVQLLELRGAKELEWHQVGKSGAFIEIDASRSKSQGIWETKKLVKTKRSYEEKLVDWSHMLLEDLEPLQYWP